MKATKRQKIISLIVLLILVVVCIAPMSLTFINSFKPSPDITRNPLSVSFAAGLENYRKAWKYGLFATGFVNSMKLCVAAILTALFGST